MSLISRLFTPARTIYHKIEQNYTPDKKPKSEEHREPSNSGIRLAKAELKLAEETALKGYNPAARFFVGVSDFFSWTRGGEKQLASITAEVKQAQFTSITPLTDPGIEIEYRENLEKLITNFLGYTPGPGEPYNELILALKDDYDTLKENRANAIQELSKPKTLQELTKTEAANYANDNLTIKQFQGVTLCVAAAAGVAYLWSTKKS